MSVKAAPAADFRNATLSGDLCFCDVALVTPLALALCNEKSVT